MIEILREHTLRSLTVQRNVFLTMVFFLLTVILILSFLLFSKTERVVIVPASFEKEFWIDGTNFSPTYLEQIGCFIGDLLLTRSPASSNMQLALLMRHTSPNFVQQLSKKLAEEVAKLKKDNASYVFFRTKVVVDPQSASVILEGDRTLFLEDRILSTAREKYKLGFTSTAGRLLLASIEKVEK